MPDGVKQMRSLWTRRPPKNKRRGEQDNECKRDSTIADANYDDRIDAEHQERPDLGEVRGFYPSQALCQIERPAVLKPDLVKNYFATLRSSGVRKFAVREFRSQDHGFLSAEGSKFLSPGRRLCEALGGWTQDGSAIDHVIN
jgi:hypothetical protein